MTDADRVEFAAVLRKIGAVFGREITADAAEGYFRALEGLPLRDVQSSAIKAMQECKFMPVPSELIALGPKRNSAYLPCGTALSQQETARRMGWDFCCEFHSRDGSKPALRFDRICPTCRQFESKRIETTVEAKMIEAKKDLINSMVSRW